MAAPRIYWDSCVAIYRVEQAAPWFERIEQHLLRLPDDARVCLTDLTWMECRVGPVRAGDSTLLARYDEFFGHADALWVPLTREVFAGALQLRALHRIKVPDALHLAAAMAADCAEFWTHDSRLASAAAGHLRVVDLHDNP